MMRLVNLVPRVSHLTAPGVRTGGGNIRDLEEREGGWRLVAAGGDSCLSVRSIIVLLTICWLVEVRSLSI